VPHKKRRISIVEYRIHPHTHSARQLYNVARHMQAGSRERLRGEPSVGISTERSHVATPERAPRSPSHAAPIAAIDPIGERCRPQRPPKTALLLFGAKFRADAGAADSLGIKVASSACQQVRQKKQFDGNGRASARSQEREREAAHIAMCKILLPSQRVGGSQV
jgi:hypothetical protein